MSFSNPCQFERESKLRECKLIEVDPDFDMKSQQSYLFGRIPCKGEYMKLGEESLTFYKVIEVIHTPSGSDDVNKVADIYITISDDMALKSSLLEKIYQKKEKPRELRV